MNTFRKILIVNDGFPPCAWGGAATIALLHARSLKARGYDVRVFTTVREGEAKWGEFEGIPVRTFITDYHPRWWAYRSLYNAGVLAEFEKELKAFAPEIVHFHNVHQFFSYHAIVLTRRSGAKVFLTAHDVMSFAYQKLWHFIDRSFKAIPASFDYHIPWWINLKNARLRFNPLRNLIIRRYLRIPDRIFAVSDALKQALKDNGIGGNVVTVHNGLDADAFVRPFDEESFREELGLSGNKIILFVGRFTPDKGRDVLLRAFYKVLQRESSARLLVVGFGGDKTVDPALWKLVQELGIEGKISFVASVPHDEINKYYLLSEVVTVPSVIFDSFPTVNLEAMAAGKPVVATCFGGSPEAVEEGVTGYILNPLDLDMFAERLLSLLSNERKARSMGEAGRARLRESFSLGKQIDLYLKAYEAS